VVERLPSKFNALVQASVQPKRKADTELAVGDHKFVFNYAVIKDRRDTPRC
jgi:hypothetical protein